MASGQRKALETDGDAQPTLQESIQAKLIQSGEKERLRALLQERLIECGWRDDLKARCRAILKRRGLANVTVDELSREITPLGRASVPDTVKAELLREIRDFLQA
mmetsp:Transcript_40351/g.77128  ORF Transcript_40351/g.77128 Transcript_40351/m.77128 type:complete len:105 (-) Transcript_40351:2936-3250(-)